MRGRRDLERLFEVVYGASLVLREKSDSEVFGNGFALAESFESCDLTLEGAELVWSERNRRLG